MTALINASTSSGVVVTSDTSGSLAFQSNGTTIMTVASTGVSTQVGSPTFSAYQSSGQTLSSGSFTKLQFQTKEWDTANCFDATTNYRFTPNVAGYYQVSGALSNNTGTQTVISIYKNGSDYKRGTNGSLYGDSISALVYLNGSTDYVELYGYFGTGTTINTGSNLTYFQAAMVRSA
jgi:hypothetical protein